MISYQAFTISISTTVAKFCSSNSPSRLRHWLLTTVTTTTTTCQGFVPARGRIWAGAQKPGRRPAQSCQGKGPEIQNWHKNSGKTMCWEVTTSHEPKIKKKKKGTSTPSNESGYQRPETWPESFYNKKSSKGKVLKLPNYWIRNHRSKKLDVASGILGLPRHSPTRSCPAQKTSCFKAFIGDPHVFC